jgi:MFS family permease
MSVIQAPAIAKKSIPFLLNMSIYNIGLNLLWVAYNSILLPLQVERTTSEATKGIWLGIITMVSILVGITINIVAGVFSDNSQSRWGRRNPTIVIGMVFTVIALLVAAFLPETLPVVFLVYFMIQFFGNVSCGAYQPLLADIVPENLRGTTSGFQGAFTIVGAALGFIVITQLVSANQMTLAVLIIAAVFLATTVYNAFVIRKEDKPLPQLQQVSLMEATKDIFRVRTKVQGYNWFIFANFLMYMGVTSFSFFGIYYFETVLNMPDPVAAMGIAGMVGIAVNLIAAVVAGIVSDKIGRKYLIIGAGVVSGVFSLFFPFLRVFSIFIAFSAVYGAANGVVYSVNQALAAGLVPPDEAGKFMAYNNLSVGLANSFSPLLFGAILNFQGAPTVTSFLFFFIASATFYFVSSIVFALKVPKR